MFLVLFMNKVTVSPSYLCSCSFFFTQIPVSISVLFPIPSGVARSLVLAGHSLYASPLALRSRALRARLRDMSRTNTVLWPGTCPARPGLCYATAHSSCQSVTIIHGMLSNRFSFKSICMSWGQCICSVQFSAYVYVCCCCTH